MVELPRGNYRLFPWQKIHLHGKHVTIRAMKYGHLHAHARNANTKYLIHEHVTVTRTRFHTDHSHNWIGALPDGLVYYPSPKNDPHGLLELNVQPVLSLHHLKICVYVKYVDGKFKLAKKRSHKYYYQIQGQLHVTCGTWCKFVVWTLFGVSLCPSTLPIIYTNSLSGYV